MRMGVFFVFFVLLYVNSFSQNLEIDWQQCYGDSESSFEQTIELLEEGYLIGIEIRSEENASNFHGGSDIWILKVDFFGIIIWEKCYGGSMDEGPMKLIKASNNEYLIFGLTTSIDGDVQSGNNGYSDLWVVKINGQGDIIWEKTYGCEGNDDARDMILTPDGGFIMINRIGIGGGDVSQFYGSGDVWMCKCDSLGNIEWEKTLGNHGLDNCISVMINNENNIVMIGATQKHGGLVECYPDEARGDVWLVELDLDGNILSQYCYGGSYYDLGYLLLETEGGYILCSVTSSNDGDVSGLHGPPGDPPDSWGDIWIVKLNEQFEIVWQKCLGGTKGDSPRFITETGDGGFLIIGNTFSHNGDVSGNNSWTNGYYDDIWVVKLSIDGEIEWEKCFGGENDETLNMHAVLKKGDYNYVIAAKAKMNSLDVQCDLHGLNDAWVFEIKDTTVGIPQSMVNQSLKTYPNPASNYVIFEINNPAIQNGAERSEESNLITITNTFGQQITQLEIKNAKTVWDTRKVQAGVYFWFVEIAGKRYSGKVVVQQ